SCYIAQSLTETDTIRLRSAAELETALARRQNQLLLELAKRPSILAGVLEDALREITEAASRSLDVARVGVWFYTPERKAIRCADLFDRRADTHTSGGEIREAVYPMYFRSLEAERTIVAHDANIDPRTAGFAAYHPYSCLT